MKFISLQQFQQKLKINYSNPHEALSYLMAAVLVLASLFVANWQVSELQPLPASVSVTVSYMFVQPSFRKSTTEHRTTKRRTQLTKVGYFDSIYVC